MQLLPSHTMRGLLSSLIVFKQHLLSYPTRHLLFTSQKPAPQHRPLFSKVSRSLPLAHYCFLISFIYIILYISTKEHELIVAVLIIYNNIDCFKNILIAIVLQLTPRFLFCGGSKSSYAPYDSYLVRKTSPFTWKPVPSNICVLIHFSGTASLVFHGIGKEIGTFATGFLFHEFGGEKTLCFFSVTTMFWLTVFMTYICTAKKLDGYTQVTMENTTNDNIE